MKYLYLVWRNLQRRRTRTIFTLLAILVCFVMFGFMSTLRNAFTMVNAAGVDRLMMTNKVSIIQPLPLGYMTKIEAVPGVVMATHSDWFGGVYQDPKNQFPQFPVDPEPWLKMYPEFHLPPDQLKAWETDRQGAVVGRETAERYGWKIGDRIPLQATIWQPKEGSWEFNIVGIYDAAPGKDRTQFWFRYDYFDEHRRDGTGMVGWYLIKIANPSDGPAMSNRMDELFANSSFETKTATESAMIQSWANQIGDIGQIIIYILIVVFFTILLIVRNTMAQSVRERTNELGARKALGFGAGLVLSLVLAESVTLSLIAGGIGLALAWIIVAQGDPTKGMLPMYAFPVNSVAIGLGLAVALGIGAGLPPALSAMRLRITDAMRRN